MGRRPKPPVGSEVQPEAPAKEGKRVPAIFYRRNRISRVFFYIDKKGRMVLLHGFIKKTQKTPHEDWELARSNKSKHQRGLR